MGGGIPFLEFQHSCRIKDGVGDLLLVIIVGMDDHSFTFKSFRYTNGFQCVIYYRDSTVVSGNTEV